MGAEEQGDSVMFVELFSRRTSERFVSTSSFNSPPDSVTFLKQLSAPLSLEHSSSLAPHLFIVSFTFDSFISSKASKVSSSGILCTTSFLTLTMSNQSLNLG